MYTSVSQLTPGVGQKNKKIILYFSKLVVMNTCLMHHIDAVYRLYNMHI